MRTVEYNLFRVKFIRPSQTSFIHDCDTPASLLLKSIQAKPSAELRVGYTWHIGNLQMFDAVSGYFAVGRTTCSTISKFDETSGNFLEEDLEESPFTHCVFDTRIGFFGIAKKLLLSPTTQGITRKLRQLLEKTDAVLANDVSVEISPISDPEEFLIAIRKAFKIYRFSSTFHGPNPFDADEFFQRPLSVYLNAAHGSKGRAVIQGENLNPEVLVEVARSAAATGNTASARVRRKKSQQPTTISLEGDPIKKQYPEETLDQAAVLGDLRELYQRVRHDKRD